MSKRKNPPPNNLHIFQPEEANEMKVTMTKTAAGPQGVARPGTVLEVKEDEGKQLLTDTAARPYDPQRDAQAKRGWRKAPDKAE